MNENKAEYRRFIQDRTDIPIFFQDWWLDIVSAENDWGVILIKDKAKRIQLVMSYIVSKRYGIFKITQPVLTPFLGAWIVYPSPNMTLSKRYSFEHKVLEQCRFVLEKERWAVFNQFFHNRAGALLPLHWNGFEISTYYRSVLYGIKDLSSTYTKIHNNRRYDIEKFNRSGYMVETTEDSAEMYDLILSSFAARKSKIPYSKELYIKIDQAIGQYGHRRIFIAKDKLGNKLAGVYVIIDFDRAYLLSTGKRTEAKDSTATSTLIWEGVQYASQFVDTFDFCGSMIPSISKFFQGFGGEFEAYPKVRKYRFWWANFIFKLIIP